ncbi:MAG: ABC transporter substrate-binding protein, partial [Deltaproteobacteria bacterium]
MMRIRKITLLITVVLVSSLIATGLCLGAETFPAKPIQVIVPFAAGGSNDVLARAVANTWTKYSPQPMLVIT